MVFGAVLTEIFGSLGCNTVHGLGQDIERGGEKTQNAADAVKRRMWGKFPSLEAAEQTVLEEAKRIIDNRSK